MHVRSYPALVLGGIFALGTAASLFWDVRALGDVTLDHLMTGLVLVGTIAAGHMFWTQAREWRVLPCLGLGVLFTLGTLYCVTSSAARNVEVGIPKALDIVASNEGRRKLEVDLTEAKEDARKSKGAAFKECASGDGARCRSLTKLADAADSHYWVLVARLASTKPEQPANPGLKHAAQVFAALPFVKADASAIATMLELFSPFAKAAFLEVATVVFFGIGLGTRQQPLPADTKHCRHTSVLSRLLPEDLLVSNPRKTSVIVDVRPDSCDDAATILAAIRHLYRPVSNTELADIMGCSPAEASRRATVALEKGLIVRQRQGRHVAISLKPPN